MNLLVPPPKSCPGTSTVDAGKSNACNGCPNQTICASGLKPPVDPDIAKIALRLSKVKHKVLVLSGKGGVGKSTVTAALAYALTTEFILNDDNCGKSLVEHVGVLDIDITGPSIPKILGVSNEIVHESANGWVPVSVDDSISCMSIAFLLPNPDDAIIWKGPKKTSMIKQFLKDVDWGNDLDILLVDTPPGTSDEHIAVVQFLADSGIDGAVIVATPQEIALQDVRKELSFCIKTGIHVIGVIENMASYVCPNCQHCEPIFSSTSDNFNVQSMCNDFSVPYLGSIPLDPRISRSCDSGTSFIDLYRNSPAVCSYMEIIEKIFNFLKKS